MSTPEIDAVVVGAGIAGLAAALELQDAGNEVLVVDPADRPGGVLRTDHCGGFVVERGANTIQAKAPLVSFLERRRLSDALVRATPASKLRWLHTVEGLQAVPMSPLAFARTPLLSARGKLRLLVEPFVRRGDGASESVAEFVGRRLGREAVTNLVAPFLTGVYAGDEDQLGAGAVFGGLVDHERRAGSIALGAVGSLFGRRGARGRPGSYSTGEGLGVFARSLADKLVEPPALGSRVARIAKDGARWRVDVTSPSGDLSLLSRRVVVAAPAPEAAEVLRGADAEVARAVEEVEYAPIVSVSLGVSPAQVASPIEGFGFIVPKEADLGLLGCLFMSELFPGRAPADRALLQCLVGGVRWREAVHEPDDALLARLFADLEETVGLREPAEVLALTRWPRAVPQPARDHVARIDWVKQRLRDLGGLAIAGSWVAGVGVADSVASGVAAAAFLAEESDAATTPAA